MGTVLGALVWWWVGREGIEHYNAFIKQCVGVIAVVFALYIGAKEASMRWVEHHKAGPKTAVVAGVAAGFTSTIAHAAGPIVGLYIFSQGLGKTLFVGTVAWTFTFINLTKVPFYMAVGLLDFSVLRFDIFLIPADSDRILAGEMDVHPRFGAVVQPDRHDTHPGLGY